MRARGGHRGARPRFSEDPAPSTRSGGPDLEPPPSHTGTREITIEPLQRLRALCLALPEAREVEAWGAPTFRVKTIFAMYSAPEGPGPDERPGAWIKAEWPNQQSLVQSAPDRFFVPPYVGSKGWIGVFLDDATDWNHVESLLLDAWRRSIPAKLRTRDPEGEIG